EVLEPVPRLGARLRDLFTDEAVLVVYPRLAETVRPGLVVPVRVMPLEGFHVLFNGPTPLSQVASVPQYQEHLFKAHAKYGLQKGPTVTAKQWATVETFQTIDVLRQRSPDLPPAHRPKPAAESPSPRFGRGPLSPPRRVRRNDPCPCGSGKKFKQCCLGRN